MTAAAVSAPRPRRPHVLVIAPPFFSHARPAATLAAAVAATGSQVTFACIPELDHLTTGTALKFFAFEGTANRNTGRASTTEQAAQDRDRLLAFLAATRQSATAALICQARNRRADMLPDPERVLAAVADMCGAVRPDWCIVDQLSYPVTLALHRLGVPFASFIAGHPTDLPRAGGSLFGVPDAWPDEISVRKADIAALMRIALDVDRGFTNVFNEAVRAVPGAPPSFASAFSFSSEYARVFNYPENITNYPRHVERDLFIGHCTAQHQGISERWREKLDGCAGWPRVLVSFGTYQWVHTDIMRRIHEGIRQSFPDAAFLIAAGDRTHELADLTDGRSLIHDFLPQQALVPHVDLVVHHGGNNSFTEAVAAGLPCIALPFAADQFAVARDISDNGLGRVLDPNHFTTAMVAEAARAALADDCVGRVASLARKLSARGPGWAAERLITLMDRACASTSDGGKPSGRGWA